MADDPIPIKQEIKQESGKRQNIKIDKEQVRKSVGALWQYIQKSKGLSKDALLDFAEQVSLQIGFVKIPFLRGNKTVKIRLAHTLMQENQDVCLFVKDLDQKNRDYSETVEHFKELLEKHDIDYVKEIIPMKSLKTEYNAYESKRNLSDMYEFYLADERIGKVLPKQLGKHFLQRKRHPVAVDLEAEDLKKVLDQGLKTSLCIITGKGASCQVKVAHTGMTEDQAVENIIKAAEALGAGVPGGSINIKSLHIRTHDSPAIPCYISKVNPNEVKVPKPKGLASLDPEEITTLPGQKVIVRPDGIVIVLKQEDDPEKVLRKLQDKKKNKLDAKKKKMQARKDRRAIQREKKKATQQQIKIEQEAKDLKTFSEHIDRTVIEAKSTKKSKPLAKNSEPAPVISQPRKENSKKAQDNKKSNPQQVNRGQKRKAAFKGKPPKFKKMQLV